jgi:hypothetical protein
MDTAQAVTPSPAPSAIKPVSIVMIDHQSGIDPAEMWPVSLALTKQAMNHFSLPPPYGYGIGATVRVASPEAPPKADEWILGLFAKADQPGALGYHDETPQGMPIIKIFPMLDKEEGSPWSVTASHEVCEALQDPNLAKCSMAPDGRIWAYEVSDAVEADTYLIDGVAMSNFCLPLYFEPSKNLHGVKLDYMGLIKTPYEIRDGGYGQWFDPSKGWQMVQAMRAMRAYRVVMDAEKKSRAARRQQKWLNTK